jgi:hypothetical protein
MIQVSNPPNEKYKKRRKKVMAKIVKAYFN